MIVARGLGRGFGRILVTAGLGLVVVASPPTTGGGGGRTWTDEDHRAAVEAKWEVIERARAASDRLLPAPSPEAVPEAPAVVELRPAAEAPAQLLPQPAPTDEVAQLPNPTLDPSLALLLASVAAEPGPVTTGAVSDEELALILLAIAAADTSTAA